jgi:PTS system N-acetylglucosamine-specific IIC component
MSQNMFSGVQHLGRALMLPIAVLPVAAILLRVGQPDVLNLPFVAAAGDAIFSNLGMLFAVGIAVGFAKESHGAAALAGLVGFLIAQKGAVVLSGLDAAAATKMSGRISIPIGILMGISAGLLYNRFRNIKLPDFLAFFGGRRFVPIITGLAALVLAALFGYGWSYFDKGLTGLTDATLGMGEFGLFLYGVANRLLIVTGLHHIINNIAWFVLGEYTNPATGAVVTGDLHRFFAGDKTAGAFMSGFFPVMMFGLPAACLAMYTTAKKENRAAVAGVLASMALTSFLTGITEPIEFSFMFLAPVLFVIHAILTGVSMVVMDMLHAKLGFGFSAGLFDYLLNFKLATKPLILLPVGAAYFAIYYGIFYVCIKVFNLETIGRETEDAETATEAAAVAAPTTRAAAYVQALGGPANILSVEACATRLRLQVADNARINEKALKAAGARGVIKPAAGSAQVIVGPIADMLADEIKAELGSARGAGVKSVDLQTVGRESPKPGAATAAAAASTAPSARAATFVQSLGGASNILAVEARSTRLLLKAVDNARIDETALMAAGARGVVKPATGSAQVIVGPSADLLADEIKAELNSAPKAAA